MNVTEAAAVIRTALDDLERLDSPLAVAVHLAEKGIKGRPQHPGECPFARYLQSFVTNPYIRVSVGTSLLMIYKIDNVDGVTIDLGEKAIAVIMDFDSGLTSFPFLREDS